MGPKVGLEAVEKIKVSSPWRESNPGRPAVVNVTTGHAPNSVWSLECCTAKSDDVKVKLSPCATRRRAVKTYGRVEC
jgi:hypothetical protein